MYHEEAPPTGRKPQAVRPRRRMRSATDDIVWAAYRKFARGGCAREAMRQCMAEDFAKHKRRVLP